MVHITKKTNFCTHFLFFLHTSSLTHTNTHLLLLKRCAITIMLKFSDSRSLALPGQTIETAKSFKHLLSGENIRILQMSVWWWVRWRPMCYHFIGNVHHAGCLQPWTSLHSAARRCFHSYRIFNYESTFRSFSFKMQSEKSIHRLNCFINMRRLRAHNASVLSFKTGWQCSKVFKSERLDGRAKLFLIFICVVLEGEICDFQPCYMHDFCTLSCGVFFFFK